MADHDLAPQRNLIAGQWSDASIIRTGSSGDTEWIEHASTGQPVQQQRSTGSASIEQALESAWKLHRSGAWSTTTVDERATMLDAMAERLESLVPDVATAESVTTGAVLSTTTMLGFILHGAFRMAADQIRNGLLSGRFDGPAGSDVELDRLPWGPALLLCPWNAPAPMAAHKAASALAAGCPVIIKPPERAPHGTASIAAAAMDAGLPDGVVQLVHGGPEVATALVEDPRVRCVSFTGGIVGGRAVAHACAEGLKPVQLELGGHSPLLVLDDATPDQVAAAVLPLLTTLNGQWCRALGRLLLPEHRREEYLEAIEASLATVTIDDPLDGSSQMGPIVHSQHLSMLEARVNEFSTAGGRVIAPAPVPDRPGNWMSPTLIDGLDPAWSSHEIFGPVATVHTHRTVEDAIELANSTEYGLEAYVVGTDVDAAMSVARQVRAGEVKVNGASPMNLHPMAPRPAFGLSGMHDEGTAETIEFFGGNRVVGVEGSL